MDLSEILTKPVVSISPEENIVNASKLMGRKNISSLLVVENDIAVGIISERDFVHLISNHENPEEVMVKSLMSSPVITADISISLIKALDLMNKQGIRRLPITQDGKLVGIITETDLTKAMRKTQIKFEPELETEILTSPLKNDLIAGKTYLFYEYKPIKSLQVFSEIVRHGMPGLLLTREDPENIKREYTLDKTPIIWLTDSCPDVGCIDPHNLRGLSIAVGEYMEEAEKSIVMIDGLTYLITRNGFETVLNILQSLRDKAMKSKSIFLLTINPKTLDIQQLELLKQETDQVIQH